jgi:hypothetical protein
MPNHTHTRTTRLGKTVGSIPTNRGPWIYWPESNWQTGERGFITVAPSGARMKWFASEADAQASVAEENSRWFA